MGSSTIVSDIPTKSKDIFGIPVYHPRFKAEPQEEPKPNPIIAGNGSSQVAAWVHNRWGLPRRLQRLAMTEILRFAMDCQGNILYLAKISGVLRNDLQHTRMILSIPSHAAGVYRRSRTGSGSRGCCKSNSLPFLFN
jgi:hypothetical protein